MKKFYEKDQIRGEILKEYYEEVVGYEKDILVKRKYIENELRERQINNVKKIDSIKNKIKKEELQKKILLVLEEKDILEGIKSEIEKNILFIVKILISEEYQETIKEKNKDNIKDIEKIFISFLPINIIKKIYFKEDENAIGIIYIEDKFFSLRGKIMENRMNKLIKLYLKGSEIESMRDIFNQYEVIW